MNSFSTSSGTSLQLADIPEGADVVFRGIFVNAKAETLLVRRAPGDSRPGQWEPAGGRDDGQGINGYARELREELGLTLVSVVDVLSIQPLGKVTEVILFVVVAGKARLSDEHDAMFWQPLEEQYPHNVAATAEAALYKVAANSALRAQVSKVN